jgi:hypothetical protein
MKNIPAAICILTMGLSPFSVKGETASTGVNANPSVDTDRVFSIAARKLAAYDAATPDKSRYPNDAKGKTWSQIPPENWVSGFYPGCLWYLYEYAKGKNLPDAGKWKTLAERWTEGLKNQQFNTGHHDTGFVIFDSYGNGFRLTGNAGYPPVINRTALSLGSRYVPTSGMIRSWGEIGDASCQTVIIDNMMNLELLFWAADHGGKTPNGPDLRAIATSHADRALELFFRPDNSTYHVVDVDPASGKVLKRRTHQGKGDETCWSRGQTWAIHGFATAYDYTKDPKYLDASKRAADYFLAHLPADQVPPSDFQSTLQGLEFKDSSAAAVAASGLLKLSRDVRDPALQKKYFEAAEKILAALTHPPYLAGDEQAGLLAYAARNYCENPQDKLTNTSLIFGDYYLLEALLAYENIKAVKKPN